MDKITSSIIDHNKPQPGICVFRKDRTGDATITTSDLRTTSLNGEPVAQTAELCAIEHLGVTYLRIYSGRGENILYFGSTGCRTGFYLLMAGDLESRDVLLMTMDTLEYIRDFEGEVPEAFPRDYGSYLDMNLGIAEYVADKYLGVLYHTDEFPESRLIYPE